MLPVQMTVTIILQVLNHLLRGASNPLGCLDLRLLTAFGAGLGVVAESPLVRGDGEVAAVDGGGFGLGFGFGFGFVGVGVGVGFDRGERRWGWTEEGRFQRLHGRILE